MHHLTGSIQWFSFSSRSLQDNPHQDPFQRSFPVYLPPKFSKKNTYPALLGLAGFLGTGNKFLQGTPFEPSLVQQIDQWIDSKNCPPVIVAFPNTWTRLGGTQYLNSSAVGNYQNYLLEIISFLEKTLPIQNWGVFGKSSGGFGAWHLCLRVPQKIQALATHSADAGFELCYLPGFAQALSEWKAFEEKTKTPFSAKKWLDYFWDLPLSKKHSHKKIKALELLAMAAHYSPKPTDSKNPRSDTWNIELPFSIETGAFIENTWKKWKAWDIPLILKKKTEALKLLKCIYFDVGTQDEYGLFWGSQNIHHFLKKHHISHVFETFHGGHRHTSFRYQKSIPYLVKVLSS